MKGLYFTCPTCNEQILCDSIVRSETDRVYLIAVCNDCEEEWKFEIDKLLAGLFSGSPKDPRGN